MNHDEMPIGTHEHPIQSTLNEPQSSSKDESLVDRLSSRAWKTRYDAFDELITLLTSSENTDIAQLHSPLFKKYIADPHPGVQEKALEVFSIILKTNPSIITSNIEEMVTAILDKCVVSMKVSLKAKAMETLVELSKTKNVEEVLPKIIVDSINKCKIPKTIVGSIQILIELMKVHGKKAFALEEIVNVIEKNAVSSNYGAVRSEALEFYKAGYLTFGEEIMPFIKRLKPAQQNELTKLLQENIHHKANEQVVSVEVKKDNPTSQMRTNVINPLAVKEDNMEKLPEEKADSKYTIESFDETWCSNILSLKVWSEKRKRLDELSNALNNPVKSPKISSELIPTLAKLINDNNSTVAQASLNILSTLTNVAKAMFKEDYKLIIKPAIIRLKDKKVANEATKCLDSLNTFIVLDDIINDLKDVLNDKSPLLKVGLCQWMERSLIPASANTDGLAELFTILSSFLDEAMSDVRESALSCLVSIYRVSKKDPVILKLLSELPQHKQEKIVTAAQSARTPAPVKRSINAQYSWKEARPPTSKLPNIDNSRRSPVNSSKRSPRSSSKRSPRVIPKKYSREPFKGSPRDRRANLEMLKKTAGEQRLMPRKHNSKGPVKRNINENSFTVDVSETDSEKLLADTIPWRIIEALNKAEWKDRLRGFQELATWTAANKEKLDALVVPLSVLIKEKLKDFKENNQTIIKEAFTIMMNLAQCPNVNKKVAGILVPGVIEKMSDSKWYDIGLQITDLLSKSSGPAFIIGKSIEKVNTAGKNLNLTKTALLLLAHIVDKNDSTSLPLKDIVDCAKQSLNNANSTVRSASTSVLCSVYKVMGEPLKQLLSDLKDATLKAVEVELTKVQPNSSKSGHKRIHSDTLDLDSRPHDLVSQNLLTSMGDPDVKVRRDAKIQLEKIISEVDGKIPAEGLYSLVSALKERVNEPCKTLAKDYATILGNLALGVGPEFKQYLNVIMNPLLDKVGDRQMKGIVLSTIDKIGEATGAETVMNYLGQKLEKSTLEVRLELLSWIQKHQESLLKCECETLISGLLSCVQDINKDVRDRAESVISIVVAIIGITPFNTVIECFSSNTKKSLKIIVAKYIPLQLNKSESKHEEDKFSQHRPKTSSTRNESHNRLRQRFPKTCESKTFLTISDCDLLPSQKAKVERAKHDKANKWNIEELSADSVYYLKDQLKSFVPPSLFAFMFSNDTNMILSSIEPIIGIIKSNTQKFTDILDLILKWSTMVIMESTNYNISRVVVGLVKTIFDTLIAMQYQLLDFEAASILPILCEKLGDEELKYYTKKIIKLVRRIYPLSKVGNYLVRALNSQSSETKAECLVLLQEFVAKHGLRVITARDIKSLGKILVHGEEQQVEFECVELLAEVYKKKGESIWFNLGELNNEVRDLLKKKFEQVVNEMESNETPAAAYSSQLSPIQEYVPTTTRVENEKIDNIEQCLQVLNKHNNPQQEEALKFINNVPVTELRKHANELALIVADSLHDIFEISNYSIQLVTQYLQLVKKLCENTEIIDGIEYDAMFKLMHELLSSLLSPQSVKFGKEKDSIVKMVNQYMVSLLEKSSLNTSFQVLITMYQKSVDEGKLPEIIVKCILRLIKTLKTDIRQVDVGSLLLALHNYVSSNKETNSHTEVGTRVVKTILNELIRILGENIWKHYEVVEKSNTFNNNSIKRWITLMLASKKPQGESSEKLTEILNKFNKEVTFEEALLELKNYKATHPDCNLTQHLQKYPKAIADLIIRRIEKESETSSIGKSLANNNTDLNRIGVAEVNEKDCIRIPKETLGLKWKEENYE